mmetsp:Transcript_9935/g.15268  ORF Transcript_9935/g.15268 Transcript_9935/m.15268 type:complete len:319 (+) Transcript_9935:58-1014(+)
MALPNLPPEVWAQILTELPIHTLMQVVMGNRFFTFEVLKQIPHLLITRSHFDMDIPTIRKTLDIQRTETVRVHCLLTGDPSEIEQPKYCVNASNKVVPLLCQFPNLRAVELKVTDVNDARNDVTGCREYYHGLLWALCGAFASRSLSKDLTFLSPLGIFCLWGNDSFQEDSNCIFCDSVLSNFPLESLLDMNSCNICFDEEFLFNAISHRLNSPRITQMVWEKLATNFRTSKYDGLVTIDYPMHTVQRMKRFLERDYLPDFTSNNFLCDAIIGALNKAQGQSLTKRAYQTLRMIGYPRDLSNYPICNLTVYNNYDTEL